MKTVNLVLFVFGYYQGSKLMTSRKLNQATDVNSNTVEEMTVELRDPVTFEVVETATGMLYTNGTLQVNFDSPDGSYYLAVKGSNLLETWTDAPVVISSTPVTYDFTTADSQAYGSNQIEVESGVFALYNGDINQDGVIDEADRVLWETAYSDFAFGEKSEDSNGDGLVDLTDFSIWETCIGKSVHRPTA
jgi:hypothetical protein